MTADAALMEFGARLLGSQVEGLDHIRSHLGDWGLFGRVVEAMREKGWSVSLDSDHPDGSYEVFFSSLPPGEVAHHGELDPNPAVAALLAARAALGEEG